MGVSLFVLLFLSACVAPDDDVAAQRAAIHGGVEVGTCDWPSVVFLNGCTGNLIHPELVLFAAHCSFPSAVRFGERSSAAAFSVRTAGCMRHENWGAVRSWDFAICELERPVTEVPIVPVLMECEAGVLEEDGRPVVSVGYGYVEGTRGLGVKREVDLRVDTAVSYATPRINLEGDLGKLLCPGDSGGPSFVQLDDGSWRQFGVTHAGAVSCDDMSEGGTVDVAHAAVDWIERETGLDLTPCHDAAGMWAPGPDCAGFPLNPRAGGTWPACSVGATIDTSVCMPSTDAGIDAGTEPDAAGPADAATDAAGAIDAGSEPDASVEPSDASTDAAVDVDAGAADAGGLPDGSVAPPSDSGCGCHAASSGPDHFLMLAGLVILWRRRSRFTRASR